MKLPQPANVPDVNLIEKNNTSLKYRQLRRSTRDSKWLDANIAAEK